MVNIELGNENVKSELINMTWAWNKEKMHPWPTEQRAGALSTELRELMESKVI